MKAKQSIFKFKQTVPVSVAEGCYNLEVKLLPPK